MARGWESKSVEEQQSEFTKGSVLDGKVKKSEEDKQKARRRQELQLTLTMVQNRLNTSENVRHKQLLQQEIDHLKGEIDRLK